MTLTIRNQTDYPDDEVNQLVRWAMKPFGVERTLVIMTYTRNADVSPYSGIAYSGLPWEMRPWPKSAWYGIKLRIGKPSAFPMEKAYWRNGSEENHHGEWPLFKHDTWQEALVAIAAHEAKHNEDFREGKRRRGSKLRRGRELTCELIAKKILDEFLAGGFKFRIPSYAAKGGDTMSETETNGLGDALRAAVSGIEGVTLVESPKGNYYTVKHGKQTLGYVNGKRTLRVDLPVRGGTREQIKLKDEGEIPSVVAQLTSLIPAGEQEAKSDPKPAPRKRKRS